MLQLQRHAVHLVAQIIARLQAVEGVVGDVQDAAVGGLDRPVVVQLAVQGDAVVGHGVAAQAIIAEGRGRLGSQAGGERHRQAVLFEVHRVAVRHVAFRRQQVQAKGGRFAEAPVAVDRGAVIVVRAGGGADVDEVGQARRLGPQVDAAAARAAARIDRIGPLDDLDLFKVEDLARLAAGVANAVDEDVVRRGLTANERTFGQRLAAFAGAEGDAGRGPQQVLQRGGGGLSDDLLGDDCHGSRRIQQGRHIFRAFGLSLLNLAMHVDGAQVGRLLVRGGDDDVVSRDIGGDGGGGDQHAGGAGGEEKRAERGSAGFGHLGATFWPDFAMRSQ